MTQVFALGQAMIVGAGADLPNTIDDAVGLANILTDNGRCAYPADYVHLLTGETATRNNILQTLDKLVQNSSPEATVIIYFSGHGYEVQTTTGKAYYLMPFGYDAKHLYKTAVSGTELVNKLQAIPAQKLLLLLDCCHAGGFDDGLTAGIELAKAPLPPEAQTLFSQGNGRILIASSRANELSYAGKPYSAFTLALIEALCGVGAAKQDGYVRVADLALHTREKVPQRTNNKQHPILNFEQADNFILAYYAAGQTTPKSLPFSNPIIEPQPGTFNQLATIQGSGAIAQGEGATAVGERGVNVDGDVGGSIITGDIQGDIVQGNIVKKKIEAPDAQIGVIGDHAKVKGGIHFDN